MQKISPGGLPVSSINSVHINIPIYTLQLRFNSIDQGCSNVFNSGPNFTFAYITGPPLRRLQVDQHVVKHACGLLTVVSNRDKHLKLK